ncbi:tetratricopeptide repeat protein [Streptomyces sp. NRRL B-3648]|uniref:tetratricopeptide repeat protein n=1 Tax=Streptomyces sp. NRRL B-3648 TaxID=1519493 RepID=UPI001F29387D|nr:tetratricopeptide repeat protein [Streptomyces sp. NRRL B-3648]
MDALPPPAAGFTGREQELARLRAALDPSATDAEQAVLVTAVSGLGGIGKTALAVQAAYAAREAGWFPGGVLFVDLHGYDDVPVTADQALQSLLRALGVDPEHIPATADERAGLYRSVLAERAAVLIVADNASSPEQVRPLLPGGSKHRVLVTSRDRLAQLGARLVPLDQLTPGAAYELLDRALRIADPDDGRVAGDTEAAARLAGLCGYLPLALQIAVALLAEDPGKPVAELADELTTSYDRLAALDDGDRSVRAAFDLSYRRLPAAQARLLSLLALAPGPEVSEEVAAVLVGVEEAPLLDLRALARAHLVERGNGPGCWRMHDLVRAFGTSTLAGEAAVRDAARERVLAHYYRWADAADDRLRWLPGAPEPTSFTSRADALAWLDRERAGLVAAVQWAHQEKFAHTAMRLGECLMEYLDWRRYFGDWVDVATTALQVARRTGDALDMGNAWNSLGLALRKVARLPEAINAHMQARDVHQIAGDSHREATAWGNLGLALQDADRPWEAIDAHYRACELFVISEDLTHEGTAWSNLGVALWAVGLTQHSIDALVLARDLHRATGDRIREGNAWNNLGLAFLKADRVPNAFAAFGEAVTIFRENENWYGVGKSLHNLALAHMTTGALVDAGSCWLLAADAYLCGNASDKAAHARARAAALIAPETPTDTPAPASPPARTADSVPPAPRPPGAPGTVAR